jgi:FMN phosphatase YigB (HAD superfamily)
MVLLGFDIDRVREAQYDSSCALYRSRGFSDLDCFPCSFSSTYAHLSASCGEEACPEMSEELESLAREAYAVRYMAFPGAAEVLQSMRAAGFINVVVTKGEPHQQEDKLRQSGLAAWVDALRILAHKSPQEWVDEVLKRAGIESLYAARCCWAIGNSVKSDVNIPVLLGCNGIYLEGYTWGFEQAELGLPCPGRYVGRIQDIRQVPDVIQLHS